MLKYSAGATNLITNLRSNFVILSTLIDISIITFNPIPLDCGIHFNINDTYYASIYMNNSGL